MLLQDFEGLVLPSNSRVTSFSTLLFKVFELLLFLRYGVKRKVFEHVGKDSELNPFVSVYHAFVKNNLSLMRIS